MSKDTINNLPLVQKYFGLKENKSVMNLLGSDYWDEMPDDLSRNEFLIYSNSESESCINRFISYSFRMYYWFGVCTNIYSIK